MISLQMLGLRVMLAALLLLLAATLLASPAFLFFLLLFRLFIVSLVCHMPSLPATVWRALPHGDTTDS